jgi:hypothetical protein
MWRIGIAIVGVAAGAGLIKWELDRRLSAQAQDLLRQIPEPPDNLYEWELDVDQVQWWVPHFGWGYNPTVNRLARNLMAEKKKVDKQLDDLVTQAVKQKKNGPPIDFESKLAYCEAMEIEVPRPDDSLLEAYRAIAQLVVPVP